VIALIVLPFALHHRSKPDASSVVTTSGPASSTPAAGPAQTSSSANDVAAPAKVAPTKPTDVTSKSTPPPAVAPPAAAPKAKVLYDTAASGEPMDKVAPAASPKALATIHGTVRVGVKVHVDAAGKVTEATLEHGGPSRYFADLSLKAARQWVFTAPEANGHSAPSDWNIQFSYTQSGVQMGAEPLTP
jgi:TonB family protein